MKVIPIGFASLVLLMFLLVALQPSRYDTTDLVIVNVFSALSERLFLGNGNNTYEIITLVSDGDINLRYGKDHLTTFLNALPGVEYAIPFANELYFLQNPDAAPHRTTYATYTYLGSMYLDFGLFGVIFCSFLTGFIIQVAYRFILSWRRTPLNLAFQSVLILKLGSTVIGGILTMGSTVFAMIFLYGGVIFINLIFTKNVRFGHATGSETRHLAMCKSRESLNNSPRMRN